MNPVWHFVDGIPQIGPPINLGPLSVTSTAVTSGVPILAPNGAVGAPGFGFSADATSGIYWDGNALNFARAGVRAGYFTNGIFTLTGGTLEIGSDVSLSRGAANRLDLASGDSLNVVSGSVLFGAAAFISSGSGTPEGVVTAPIGSLFLRTNGGAGTSIYVKESGAGNTGWVAK